MRYPLLSALLAIAVIPAAHAQEGKYSQTLDEQLQRVQQGEAPVPAPWEKPAAPDAPATTTADAAAPVAHASPIDSEGGGAIPDLPLETMKSGNITYITGGVGDEEKAQLLSQKDQYNLHLLMTAPGGAFVSDVALHLTDASGKEVLAIDDTGPYFYAHLTPGTYKIEAIRAGGESKQVKFTVPAKGAAHQEMTFGGSSGLTTVHAPTATVD